MRERTPPAALLLAFLLGAAVLPGCATLKASPGAAKSATIACAKADAGPILQLAAALGVQALLAAIDQGAIDWPALEAAAATQGKVVGGCAFTRFIADLAKAPRSDTAARSLLALPDLAADARASATRLSARFGGATWSLQ